MDRDCSVSDYPRSQSRSPYQLKFSRPVHLERDRQEDLLLFPRYPPLSLHLLAAGIAVAVSVAVAMASGIHRSQVDLVDFVDWRGVECLNQNTGHSISNALKQGYRDDDGLHLESDADEQLLIYIPFTQVVKLHSVTIKGPEEDGPRTVKLFANKENMGFSNVNDYPPSDSFVLSQEDLMAKPINVKYVKFQNVRSLTIFIEDNQGGNDISKVQKVVLNGTTVDTTNMKELKKIEEH